MIKAKIIFFFALAVLWPTESSAFYARDYFSLSADRGGGGRLYYTGSQIERGWDCTACHLDAPGIVRVTLVTDPPELLTEKRYVPGTSYNFEAVMENETRGLEARGNANGMLAEISTGSEPAGVLKEGEGTVALENNRVVGSNSEISGATRWKFYWTAPERGVGPVTIYLAAVDGNGAEDREVSRQDHLGDDVYVARLTVGESAGASTVVVPTLSRPKPGPWISALVFALLTCAMLLGLGSMAFQRLRA